MAGCRTLLGHKMFASIACEPSTFSSLYMYTYSYITTTFRAITIIFLAFDFCRFCEPLNENILVYATMSLV